MIRENRNIEEIADTAMLPKQIIRDIAQVVKKAKKYKNREILVSLR